MTEKNQNIIDQLLISYILGEADSETIIIVEDWLKKDDENVLYFEELQKIWNKTKDLSPKPIIVDKEKAWNNILDKINEQNNKIFNINNLYKVAAIVFIAFGIFFIYNYFINQSKEMIIVSAKNVLVDTLSDGSIISLNKDSKLITSNKFDKKSRNVKLEGEAFFEIAHNSKKPFIIETEAGFIQVIGTKFNVNTEENDYITVFVEEGIVKLFSVKQNDTTAILLTKNEKGRIDKTTGIPEKLNNKTENYNDIFWKTKILKFESNKLSDVSNLLENYYNVEINLSPDIKDLKLTTSFENEDIETVLEIIKLTFNLEISKSGNKYYITKSEK